MTNLASPLPRLLAPSLLVLLMGCSSTAIVGTEDEPLPGGMCEGACPSPAYADDIEAGWSEIMDVAPTPDGGAVFLGRFSGALILPDQVFDQSDFSGNDEFLIKRAADGAIAWVRRIKGNTVSAQVAVRPDGTLVLAGCFQDTADFGTGAHQADGFVDMFVQTIFADGTVTEPHIFDTELMVSGMAIAPDGDLLLAGSVMAKTTLEQFLLVPQGIADGALVRMTADGDVDFARVTFAPDGDSFLDIVALPGGGALTIGHQGEPFSWDTVSLPVLGQGHDHFLLAVDDEGFAVWGNRIDPTPGDDSDSLSAINPSLALTAEGRAVVGFASQLGAPQAPDPAYTLAFQVFDAAGTRLGHVDFGSGGFRYMALAVTSDADVLVAGGFHDLLTIAGAQLDADADDDGFLTRLSPTGELRWVKTFGAPTSFQTATHVVATSGDRPVVGGQYRGSFSIGDDDMPLAADNPRAFVAGFQP